MTTTPTRAQYKAARPVLALLDEVSDNEGTIQAVEARRIMPASQPTWHEVQSYATAARRLGLEQDEDGDWYVVSRVATVRAFWDDRPGVDRPGWYYDVRDEHGDTLTDSVKIGAPVDADAFAEDEGDALEAALQGAYPLARIQVR